MHTHLFVMDNCESLSEVMLESNITNLKSSILVIHNVLLSKFKEFPSAEFIFVGYLLIQWTEDAAVRLLIKN